MTGEGLLIDDWGLQDCLLGVWFCWSGHGSRIVRGFCFVKCGAREIPAFAGMTWEGAEMVWVVAGVTLVGVQSTPSTSFPRRRESRTLPEGEVSPVSVIPPVSTSFPRLSPSFPRRRESRTPVV